MDSRVRVDEAPLLGVLLGVTIFSFGLLGWTYFLYAGSRLRRSSYYLYAGLYALPILFLLLTIFGQGTPGFGLTCLTLPAAVVAIIHAIRVKNAYDAHLRAGVPPAEAGPGLAPSGGWDEQSIELGHLVYLESRLEGWHEAGVLPGDLAAALLESTRAETRALRLALGLEVAPAEPEVAVPIEEAVPAAPEIAVPAAPQPVLAAAPSPAAVPEAVPLPAEDIAGLVLPVAEPRPPFSWRRVGEYLLSERTLNALLGLGAFLTLAAGFVISIFNPTHLRPLAHLGAVAVTTLIFYGIGYLLRQRVGLVRTGEVLLAIGGGFIPLAIWTAGQRDLLDWNLDTVWLVASVVGLAIYLGSHTLLRDRAFAGLIAAAGVSTLLAVIHRLGLGMEWGLCAVVALAAIYVVLGRYLGTGWRTLATAFAWAAQLVTPAVMAVLMAAAFVHSVQTFVHGAAGTFSDYAVGTAWWLGAVVYAVAARLYERRRYWYAAAWVVPFASLFTLTKAPWNAEWYNLCLAMLAAAFLLIDRPYRPVMPATFPREIRRPTIQVGLAVALGAALWPFAHLDSAIPTQYLLVAVLAVAAWRLRLATLRYATAFLLPVAAELSLEKLARLNVTGFALPWHGLWLAGLAGLYLAFGRVVLRIRRRDSGTRAILALAAQPVYLAALVLTVVAALWPWAGADGRALTLYAVSAIYVAGVLLLDLRPLAYAAIYLLPVGWGFTLRWMGLRPDAAALAWAAGAAALVAAAEVALRLTGEAHRPRWETVSGLGTWRARFAAPLLSAGYAVGLLALTLALGRYTLAPATALTPAASVPLIVALALLAAIAAASSATRRTSGFFYLAAPLLVLPLGSAALRLAHVAGLSWTEARLAVLLAAVGLAYLGVSRLLDRVGGHYAKPVYLLGYVLSVAAIPLSAADRATNAALVGVAVVVYATSAWLVHRDRHPSYRWLVDRLFTQRESAPAAVARALFLYLATWLFPAWLLLAMSLWHPLAGIGRYGLALALLGPLYAWLGLRFRLVRLEYRWPWYAGGYALSVAGPLVALGDPTLRIAALAVTIALYVGSAVLARSPRWLYPAAVLGPILAWQGLDRLDATRDFGVALVGLSLFYACVGAVLHHGGWRGATRRITRPLGRFALPLFMVGYAVSAAGLAACASQDAWRVLLGFGLGAVLYAGSALASRQRPFAWPLAGTLAVAYVAALTLLPLDARYHGLSLLPGALAMLLGADLLRERAPAGSRYGWRDLRLDAWATPFHGATYAGTAAALVLSHASWTVAALAWWGVAGSYLVSTVLTRRPLRLHVALATAVVGWGVTTRALLPGWSAPDVLAGLIVPSWSLILGGAAVERLAGPSPTAEEPEPAWRRALPRAPWALPPAVWGLVALAVAALGSAPHSRAGLVAAGAAALLLGTLGTLRSRRLESSAALALAALAFEQALRLAGVPWANQPVRWAIAAVVLAAGTLLLQGPARVRRARSARLWRPVAAVGSGLAALVAVGGGVALAGALQTRAAVGGLSETVAVVGLALVTHALLWHRRSLGYAGVALVEVGYVLQLLIHDVNEPQAFVIPAGLYLLAVGYLEWHRAGGRLLKATLESGALILLAGTTFLQSVGLFDTGDARFGYATFLVLEGAALFALGAALHWRRSFFGGAVGIVTGVLVLLVEPMRTMNTWYLVLIIGVIMLAAVGFIEQRRRQIPAWVNEWRVRLETWD